MKKNERATQINSPATKAIAPIVSMNKYIRDKERSLLQLPCPSSHEENKNLFYNKPIFSVKRNDPL